MAWSLKAGTHSDLVQVGPADRIAREQDAAETAALRAIELESGLGVAYARLGYTLSQERKWIEAERAYRRAEALGYANTGGSAYGILLMAAGKFSRAREVHLIGRNIDPLNPTLRAFLVASQGLDGAIGEALEEHKRARAIYGEFGIGDSFAFWLRLAAGEVDSADDITVAGLVNDAVKPYFDTPARAMEVLRELSVDPAYSEQTLQTGTAIWAGYLGAPECALEIVQELITRNSQNLYAVWFPQMAAMRQLSGFKTLLREVTFLEYWNEFGWPDIWRPESEDDFECDSPPSQLFSRMKHCLVSPRRFQRRVIIHRIRPIAWESRKIGKGESGRARTDWN